jgi:Fe-S cluster assembly protein SufD
MTDYIKEQFNRLPQDGSNLAVIRQEAFDAFGRMGIPTTRHEEWKYTRISSLFNKEYQLADTAARAINDIASFRIPGSEAANEVVFVNGVYAADLSVIRSAGLTVQPLETAAGNEYSAIVKTHFNHSAAYLNDGIHALNTALSAGGVFIHAAAKQVIEHPVYIYNLTDTRTAPVLSQPRSLIYIGAAAIISLVETYVSLGVSDSITNQVMEMAVEQDAVVEYYKIQNDTAQASQVSTAHIRQIGKSVVNTVTISLNGGIVRNNLHVVMEASHAEAHMYGLYLQRGNSHIDNHTIVDNAVPHCQSNELYKGVLDGNATGVFNGKIFVRKDAQKTNAFQSNKNVLLSDTASMNTKPQLEIYADDVKCSHGCTIGSLDEEGLFYLRSRGIPQKEAMALLLQGFAMDVLEKIKSQPIRTYVEALIVKRLITEA